MDENTSPAPYSSSFTPTTDAPISRRHIFLGGAALLSAAVLTRVAGTAAAQSAPSASVQVNKKTKTMTGFITTKDGRQLYYKDWGAKTAQAIVFSHGWPLNGAAWEDRMSFLASQGYRVVAHDRRGHGRSQQALHRNDLGTYADDLAALTEALDLRNAIYIEHSTGGGEVTRYIGRYGTGHVAKAVIVSVPSRLPRRQLQVFRACSLSMGAPVASPSPGNCSSSPDAPDRGLICLPGQR